MTIKNIFIGLLFLSYGLQAQLLKPAQWTFKTSQDKIAIGDTLTLIFQATIEEGWYLYGADFSADLGPMPTNIQFEQADSNQSYTLIGGIETIGAKKKYDDIFEAEYTAFTKQGLFQQVIKIEKSNLKIKGFIQAQVCTEKEGKCVPINETFAFENIKVIDKKKDKGNSDTILSLFQFFLIAFLAGLSAILTPCVFPMIPLTVSFFNNPNQSGAKGRLKALSYGGFIVLIYVFLGSTLSLLMGAEIANFITTHWLPNSIFFLVFTLFAFSFFGMFEIVLPNHFVNKVDGQSDKIGGYGKIFFMALTLVLVSFSCTGPIVGSILVVSASGEVIRPVVGMLGFAFAFAFPFSFLAFFPSVLQKMPKSGGWMTDVKVTLGFIELALALKFLSNVDLVYRLDLLSRDLNIAIWIAIAVFMTLYYLGKIRIGHSSPLERISAFRMLLALACFTFVIYLIPGLFGAPLKHFSGFLPPKTSQKNDLWKDIQNIDYQIENLKKPELKTSIQNTNKTQKKYSDKFQLPYGLQGFFEYNEALKEAKKQNKPLLIDFTGHACSNCRRMEEHVWVDKKVLKRLKNDFILVSLYVDDKTLLPENEWKISTHDGKIKKTIGSINADFQITAFQNNAQPFYVIVNSEEKPLVAPKAYDLDIEDFIAFLDSGIDNYSHVN